MADAAAAVTAVASAGRSTEDALYSYENAPHRAAVRAIALGTLRWYLRLAPAIDALLSQPRGLPDEVHALLVTAVHQIEYSRNAPQATVHGAVDATRILRKSRASGVVNAVLRRFLTERAEVLTRVDQTLGGRFAHPTWLVEALERAWPGRTLSILEANNAHPPMVLRLDLTKESVAQYLGRLREVDLRASAIDWAPAAIRLERPVAVALVPGFRDGLVSIQDGGAQLAAILLDAGPGMRVLDACAAPGGKTGHLLERTPDLAELVAVDIDAQRLERVGENLRRLRRSAKLVAADIRAPETFWDGRPFERILIDAPCSSTGVIRRHPDIKLLRRRNDSGAFAARQAEILPAAFSMLAEGGRLLYSTCSILPEENDQVIERFLADEHRARAVPLPEGIAPGAVTRRHGIQLLPDAEADTDGFYYACVEKTTTGT